MKRKFLPPEEFQKKFKLENKLEFSTESPFNSISVSPEKTLFIARHWDQPFVLKESLGTAYICRMGDSPYNFDFDVLSFRPDSNGGLKVVHIYTDYHHTNEIPPFIEVQMPDDIKNRIHSHLKSQK